MKTIEKLSLLVAGVVITSVATSPAQAINITTSNGLYSSVSGATTIDFDSSKALPSNGTVTYTNLNNAYAPVVSGSVSGKYAAPAGDVSPNYLSVAPNGGKAGDVAAIFNAPISYFGLYWGSLDSYNTIKFFNGNTLLASYTGTDIANALTGKIANGNQVSINSNFYANFFADPGQSFTKVEFLSSGFAFESDNHAYVPTAAVPEPTTMVGLTLAGVGLLARRRQTKVV